MKTPRRPAAAAADHAPLPQRRSPAHSTVLVTALLALVLTGLGLPNTAQAEDAAADPTAEPIAASRATCAGYSCTGELPDRAGCDDDPNLTTVTSRAGYGGVGRIEARYSPGCRAVWARYNPSGAQEPCYEIRIQVQTGVRDADGNISAASSKSRVSSQCASYYWSPMVGTSSGRYARVRSGYVLCSYQDPCDVAWTGWSTWGRTP